MKETSVDTTPAQVNGKLYYSVTQFAYLTGRTTQTIYRLINHGNAVRKLDCDHILEKPMIPVSEYEDFPFCSPGPFGKFDIYRFGERSPNA